MQMVSCASLLEALQAVEQEHAAAGGEARLDGICVDLALSHSCT